MHHWADKGGTFKRNADVFTLRSVLIASAAADNSNGVGDGLKRRAWGVAERCLINVSGTECLGFLRFSPHLFSEARTEPSSISLSFGFTSCGACLFVVHSALNLFPLEIMKHTEVYVLHTKTLCLAFSFMLYTLIMNLFNK